MSTESDQAHELAVNEKPVSLQGAEVSEEFFLPGHSAPMLGRWFVPEDYRPGGAPVVALNYDLWQRQFGGSPAIIGRTIQLDGHPKTVIGVVPTSVTYPKGVDLWVPK
jgi:hypothetical protein